MIKLFLQSLLDPLEDFAAYRRLAVALYIANNDYHNGVPTGISDESYDRLYRRLLEFEKDHPQDVLDLSPTQSVGAKVKGGVVKVHGTPMLSLSNCLNQEELLDWVKDVLKNEYYATIPSFTLVAEPKYDGCAVTLQYENGDLVEARTRGDGVEGEVITPQILTIKNIPISLKEPYTGEIRGEVVLFHKDFDELNARGDKVYANPRNAVAGLIRLQDMKRLSSIPLHFMQYSIHPVPVFKKTPTSTVLQVHEWLSDEGFDNANDVLISYVPITKNLSEEDIRARLEEIVSTFTEQRKELSMMIDGIVFKINGYAAYPSFGSTTREPRYATAFKFPPEEGNSYVESVDWQVGRTGALTPVANIQPLPLGGTIVSRVTLHNRREIERLGICIGSMVRVVRSGDVIPKIISATSVTEFPASHGCYPVDVPTHCPHCESYLRVEETELFCPNFYNCPEIVKQRLEYFVSRDGIDLKGFGPSVINALYTGGEKIKSVKEFLDYFLSHATEDICAQYRGIPAIEKLVDTFNKRIHNLNAVDLMAAMGIPRVGHTVSRKLIEEYGSLDMILFMSELSDAALKENLCNIDGISDITALAIRDFIETPDVTGTWQILRLAGVQLLYPKKSGDTLKGMTFVVTGKWSDISRDGAKDIILSLGGKIGSNPGAATVLIVGNGGNATPNKVKKAKDNSVPVLSWSEFKTQYNIA